PEGEVQHRETTDPTSPMRRRLRTSSRRPLRRRHPCTDCSIEPSRMRLLSTNKLSASGEIVTYTRTNDANCRQCTATVFLATSYEDKLKLAPRSTLGKHPCQPLINHNASTLPQIFEKR